MKIRLLIGALVLFTSELASAAPGGAERAAAESLYREATQLAQNGQFEAACPKYETSQKLDPALGTMLRLADCWDRTGRTASAWALFLEAAALSEKVGEVERMQIAKERARALESRLTKVVLVAEFEIPEDYEITLAGAPIDPRVWATPLPVDPGKVVIKASAPGHETREEVIRIVESTEIRKVSVPRLKPAPKEAPRGAVTEAPAPRKKRAWQLPTGIVVGGLGVGAMATGGVFAYLASTSYRKSLEGCLQSDPNQCTASGVQQRNQALRQADLSTVLLATGGGLTALGLGLVIFRPKPSKAKEAPPSASLELKPVLGVASAGISLSGRMQ